MSTYTPICITYNTAFGAAGVSAAIYTCPAATRAKITFVRLYGTGLILKVNGSGADVAGTLMTAAETWGGSAGTFNLVDFGVYLGPGDDLYVYCTNALAAPAVFISLIEESA
jgi:hypothetical protein